MVFSLSSFLTDPCDDLSLRLSNPVTEIVGQQEVTSGILEVCYSESYLEVCFTASGISELATAVCHGLGFDGELAATLVFLSFQ